MMNVDSCNIEVAKYICNVKYADWLKSFDTAEGQFANKEKYGIMKLASYENAVISDAKLSWEALNPEHLKSRD
ncbi:hypothetical protein, partial [Anaerovibrio slackiae]|uniref:hypothetical protein n=1 Tax=Anaerovibrio slackiae TaxID=2652309 RepID=UPI003867C364